MLPRKVAPNSSSKRNSLDLEQEPQHKHSLSTRNNKISLGKEKSVNSDLKLSGNLEKQIKLENKKVRINKVFLSII
jgi:hypothetical protein